MILLIVIEFQEVNRRGFKRPENVNNFGGFSRNEIRRNVVCSFWMRGICSFGDSCRNLHEEIPFCQFDGRCRNPNCQFLHSQAKPNSSSPNFPSSSSSSSPSFLSRGARNNFRFRAEDFPRMEPRGRFVNQNQRRW